MPYAGRMNPAGSMTLDERGLVYTWGPGQLIVGYIGPPLYLDKYQRGSRGLSVNDVVRIRTNQCHYFESLLRAEPLFQQVLRLALRSIRASLCS